MMRLVAIIAALFLPALAAQAGPTQPAPRVGDVFEIRRVSESASESNDRSSGSTYDRDTLTERVIGVREDGLELEYDLPTEVTAEDRARQWQLPVRVFKPHRGPLQLLNGDELAGRAEIWLKAAGLPRAACGRWYFTWNAFRIDCDPQSVIKTIEAIDLGPSDLREGALYQFPGTRGPAPLTRKPAGQRGETFVVELIVDPDVVRRERAEADVAVAEIMRKPLTLEDALRERATQEISGTITITFDTDSAGRVQRQTRVTRLKIRGPGELLETRTVTTTLERRLIAGPA